MYIVGSLESGLKGLSENISTQVCIMLSLFNFYTLSCDTLLCFNMLVILMSCKHDFSVPYNNNYYVKPQR